eukprot:320613_1
MSSKHVSLILLNITILLYKVDSLTSSDCSHIVSTEDIQFYNENGYIMIPNVLDSNELINIQTAYQQLFNRRLSEGDQLQGKWKGSWNNPTKTNSNTEQNTAKVYSIHDVEYHDNIFSKLILWNHKIGCYLELGTNSTNVLLHHTKAHSKPAKNGAAFPPHQDFHYFPYEQHSMVAIFVHLDDTNEENGGLIIWPKSHQNGAQFDQGLNDSSGYHYLNMSEFPYESGESVIANAGDAVMFSYLTVHASYPNKSNRDRRMVLVQAVSANDKPLSMIHRHSKGQGLVLRGINPNLRQNSHYKRKEKELDVIEQELQKKTEL